MEGGGSRCIFFTEERESADKEGLFGTINDKHWVLPFLAPCPCDQDPQMVLRWQPISEGRGPMCPDGWRCPWKHLFPCRVFTHRPEALWGGVGFLPWIFVWPDLSLLNGSPAAFCRPCLTNTIDQSLRFYDHQVPVPPRRLFGCPLDPSHLVSIADMPRGTTDVGHGPWSEGVEGQRVPRERR